MKTQKQQSDFEILVKNAPAYTQKIPERVFQSINMYVAFGTHPGDFVKSVICNDLRNAIFRADDTTITAIREIMWYFHNELPGNCWGNYTYFKEWIDKKHLEGEAKRE